MNDRLKLEKYKGKEILCCDFSNLMLNEFINLLHESYEQIETHQELLLYFDVEKAAVFGDAMKEAKIFAKKIHPYRKKSALTGVKGAKKTLLDAILLFSGTAKHVRAFHSKELAYEWLIE